MTEEKDLSLEAVYRDAAQPLEGRVDALLAALTLEEKVSLLGGAAAFELNPVPRLGIPALKMTDGPTGVRSNTGAAATVFPVGVAIAASFNAELAFDVAAAIGREAKALGERVILAPTINIVRTPIWGRNFETYSEDPHIAAAIGAAYVRGLQSEGVGASLKHYAANNQELNRMETSVEIDERVLREIYLSAFETVVREANPWTVMASYNRLRGEHASESRHLLTEILKEEWGYDGVVVSDWGATHSAAPALVAGLDLEMPGPPRHFGAPLLEALKSGEAPMSALDGAARRMCRLLLRCGLLDGGPAPAGEIRTDRHRAIARRAAEEGAVLLRNAGRRLPLDPRSVRGLALIGPNARHFRYQGGGSSRVRPGRRPTPLDSFRALLGEDVRIEIVEGCDPERFPPAALRGMFSPDAERTAEGMVLETFASEAWDGEPLERRIDPRLSLWTSAMFGGQAGPRFRSALWRGYFWPETDGDHEFAVRGDGPSRILFDGREIIGSGTSAEVDRESDVFGDPATCRVGGARLEAGRGYPIEVRIVWPAPRPGASFQTVSLGVRQPTPGLEAAVEAARRADATFVFVGSASRTEAEGYDRDSIELPGAQNALVEAVLDADPDAVVVVNVGAAVSLPWAERARAVLVSWLPGEEGPDAVAGLLFGEASPSGRLPVTFPRKLSDIPAQAHYTGDATAPYAEGFAVGYRHFDASNTPPQFAFGHGLTYGEFAYADLETPAVASVSGSVPVSFTLKNVGPHAASEAAQVYVARIDRSDGGPPKALKSVTKLRLAPGEHARASVTLRPGDFARFDPGPGRWRTDPGEYEILVGASAADIRLSARIRLTES